jgi:hypothetical protein
MGRGPEPFAPDSDHGKIRTYLGEPIGDISWSSCRKQYSCLSDACASHGISQLPRVAKHLERRMTSFHFDRSSLQFQLSPRLDFNACSNVDSCRLRGCFLLPVSTCSVLNAREASPMPQLLMFKSADVMVGVPGLGQVLDAVLDADIIVAKPSDHSIESRIDSTTDPAFRIHPERFRKILMLFVSVIETSCPGLLAVRFPSFAVQRNISLIRVCYRDEFSRVGRGALVSDSAPSAVYKSLRHLG